MLIGIAVFRSAKLITSKGRSSRSIYAYGPQGLAYTHKDQLNADLMEFIKT